MNNPFSESSIPHVSPAKHLSVWGMPGGSRRWISCGTLLLALIVSHPTLRANEEALAAKLEKMGQIDNVKKRLNALTEFASKLSAEQVSEAVADIGRWTEMRERVVFSRALFERWAELDPGQAFSVIAAMPEGLEKLEAVRATAPAYARKSVRAAADAAKAMTPGGARIEAVRLVSETWAESDANSAIEWASQLSEPHLRDAALYNIYFVWVHADPAAVLEIAEDLAPGVARMALLINVAGGWAEKDPAAALGWTDSLADVQEKNMAIQAAMGAWADKEPQAAYSYANEILPEKLRADGITTVAERWATQNPEQAISTVAKLPEATLRNMALECILRVCVPVHPTESATWLETHLPEPARDEAIDSYLELVQGWDPEAGVKLAYRIRLGEARWQAVEKCFPMWKATNPEAASKWISETDFPEEVKNRFMTETLSTPLGRS